MCYESFLKKIMYIYIHIYIFQVGLKDCVGKKEKYTSKSKINKWKNNQKSLSYMHIYIYMY